MKRRVEFVLAFGLAVAFFVAAAAGESVLIQKADVVVEAVLVSYPQSAGTVAYQGPAFQVGDENWKPAHRYTGVEIRELLAAVGGMVPADVLTVVAADGYSKQIPYAVLSGETPAGRVILAVTQDGSEPGVWQDAPELVFLPPDERLSNEDMLEAFGEALAHFYAPRQPSTTGFLMKNVACLIVNYAGGALPTKPTQGATPPAAGVSLKVVKGGTESIYTLADLEALDTITAPGTFTTSAGMDYSATYTGVPLATLVGNAPADATVRVTASDGYSMNYEAGMLLGRTEGTWILAYKENGASMPSDPGPLRVVFVGETNPHFQSSLSAKMVERIEVLGTYESYSLVLKGVVTRTFTRAELEAGLGCPCHAATVNVTSKGETHTYTGLPLWRLVAYVDDDRFPAPEQGIHYEDGDFDDALARTGYTVTLLAQDGYLQSVSSSLIARDDRFIVAFKRDGVFLDASKDGYMRFVYDDSVVLSEGVTLKSVKFLAEIDLGL
jgi:hypothetical protein